MMRVRCVRCALSVAVTDIHGDGYSFELEPGFALSDVCPVAKAQKMRAAPPAEESCSHLVKAIRAEIHCRVLAEV